MLSGTCAASGSFTSGPFSSIGRKITASATSTAAPIRRCLSEESMRPPIAGEA
jgi:hypothetical protein